MGITGAAQFGFDRRRMSLAIRRLPHHPNLFSEGFRLDAENILGIGSRQVVALADWLRWSGLAIRDGGATHLTPLGQVLLDYDETLEDRTSWHVIHHMLAAERSGATAYWLAFRRTSDLIDRDGMLALMRRDEPGRKDRTYEDAYRNLAQVLANPEMSATAAIVKATESGFARVANAPVSSACCAWMLLDWAQGRGLSTVTLTELCGEDGPARPFRMSEDYLADLLHQAMDRLADPWLSVSRTAGLDSVAILGHPASGDVLRSAYSGR